MGMTYSAYIIPHGSVDFKKYRNDPYLDSLYERIREVGDCIIDDDTFDRENLGSWLGLTDKQWDSAHNNGYCIIMIDQIKRAIKVLEDLDKRVAKMPFKTEGRNAEIDRKYDKEADMYVGKWDGPKENEAIYREVKKVINKDYNYVWPWENIYSGCSEFINALKFALEHININYDLNEHGIIDHEIVLLYF